MDYKLIEEFNGILENSWKQEREEFIRDSREMGFNHELSEELNEDDVEEEEEDSRKEASIKDEEYETGDESPSTLTLSDALDYDRVKRDLNQFRASHSLSDPEVDSELKNYFDRLSEDEKKILYVFVKGLTQVTLLDVSGKTANVPSDMKFQVTKKGSATSEKLKSKARAQELSVNLDDEEKMQDLTNQPIVIGDKTKQKESIQEIIKIVKENA
jgi:hypothetical protein